MKADRFITLLRKVISEEVRKAVRSEITELLTEGNSNKPKAIGKTYKATPSRKKEKNYASDPMLNSILNETANDYDPSSQKAWPTMNGKGYNKTDLASMMGYGDMQSKPTIENMVPAGIHPSRVPEGIANALTKDYTGLMKAMNKKKEIR